MSRDVDRPRGCALRLSLSLTVPGGGESRLTSVASGFLDEEGEAASPASFLEVQAAFDAVRRPPARCEVRAALLHSRSVYAGDRRARPPRGDRGRGGGEEETEAGPAREDARRAVGRAAGREIAEMPPRYSTRDPAEIGAGRDWSRRPRRWRRCGEAPLKACDCEQARSPRRWRRCGTRSESRISR